MEALPEKLVIKNSFLLEKIRMESRKILVTGASGLLGNFLCGYLLDKKYNIFGCSNFHSLNIPSINEIKVDLLNKQKLEKVIFNTQPQYIIHSAGLTNVDECEKNESLAKRIHIDVSEQIAKLAYKINAKLVHISTDHLWDGTKPMVTEDCPIFPVNVYGKTKGEAEKAVLSNIKDAIIVRTNFYGKGLGWRKSFSDWIIDSLNKSKKFNGFSDVFFTPISIFHLSKTILELININAIGIYHTVGCERISKFDFAVSIAKLLNKPVELIKPVYLSEIKLYAPRPFDMSLSTQKIQKLLGSPMPDIKSGISTLLN